MKPLHGRMRRALATSVIGLLIFSGSVFAQPVSRVQILQALTAQSKAPAMGSGMAHDVGIDGRSWPGSSSAGTSDGGDVTLPPVHDDPEQAGIIGRRSSLPRIADNHRRP